MPTDCTERSNKTGQRDELLQTLEIGTLNPERENKPKTSPDSLIPHRKKARGTTTTQDSESRNPTK
jgi:hypothetical protein